jgi:hypothetical protein
MIFGAKWYPMREHWRADVVLMSKDIRGQKCQVPSSMTKEADYRNNAAEMVQFAQRASSSADKRRLLRMAEAWLDLADRAYNAMRRSRKPGVLHPLVREKIDRRM